MQLPSIAIINFASELSDQEVQDAVRAMNRQVIEDFMPIWGCGRLCRLHESVVDVSDEDSLTEERVQADSVIYLVDESSLPGALGYHSINASELPVGFVFVELGDWTITLSHEVLELIVDPSVNIFVIGPDPRDFDDDSKFLWHSYEVCDAVERISYRIDGVELSDFVTPAYFSEGDTVGTRNDFLGTEVPSFGLLPGCHLGVVDPNTLSFVQINAAQAHVRTEMMNSRFNRYARPDDKCKPERPSDGHFSAILRRYNKNPPAGCKKLPALKGITRTGRVKATAADIYWE